jgi:hypothetical protein
MVARQPNGQPVREDARNAGYWNKYKHGVRKMVGDQHYNTTLGELHYFGKITDSQFQAAFKFFMPIMAQYDEVQEYTRSTKPHSYERVDKGRSVRDEEKDGVAVKKYYAAHAALVSAGMLAEKWTMEAVKDRYVPQFHAGHVKAGLEALALHFGLVRK